MLPGCPGHTLERAAQPGGIVRAVHSVLAVYFFPKEPHPPRGDGVSTYLALTFGTLLSSQGTEASFTAVSPAPPGFPFCVSNLTRSASRFWPPVGAGFVLAFRRSTTLANFRNNSKLSSSNRFPAHQKTTLIGNSQVVGG